MSAVPSSNELELEEQQIAEFLECRYGDGMIYLSKAKPMQLLSIVKSRGFVDAEGYITRKGRMILAQYS